MVQALARRCDEVVVICDRVGRHDCAANVRFRTFGSASRIGRGLAFERAACSGAPASDPSPRVPCSPTWCRCFSPSQRRFASYTGFRSVSGTRTGTRADRCAWRHASPTSCSASTERSFPLPTPKLRGIGHAIDVTRFVPPDGRKPHHGRLRLLALGRMTSWKGYTTMLAGLELATRAGSRRRARDPGAGAHAGRGHPSRRARRARCREPCPR